MVRGWVEPQLTNNHQWRWWTFWREKYIVTSCFIPDDQGNIDQEMTVVDFENMSQSDGYTELKDLARLGRV